MRNIRFIKESVLNDQNNNILKAPFLNYTNPLLMAKNVDISDLRSEIFNNIEQQESGDFLR